MKIYSAIWIHQNPMICPFKLCCFFRIFASVLGHRSGCSTCPDAEAPALANCDQQLPKWWPQKWSKQVSSCFTMFHYCSSCFINLWINWKLIDSWHYPLTCLHVVQCHCIEWERESRRKIHHHKTSDVLLASPFWVCRNINVTSQNSWFIILVHHLEVS